MLWGTGVAGALVERKRRVEREHIRDGLRVWLERKATQIRSRQKDAAGGVGILVWRFSRKMKLNDSRKGLEGRLGEQSTARTERVTGLKRYWENVSGGLCTQAGAAA